jgi:hypothetical protein
MSPTGEEQELTLGHAVNLLLYRDALGLPAASLAEGQPTLEELKERLSQLAPGEDCGCGGGQMTVPGPKPKKK